MDVEQNPVIPVVVLKNADLARDLAAALVLGGIPIAEVTFRTPAAAESIRRMAENPGLLVGAGTVLTPLQVEEAHAAGASFIVSPGFNPDVVTRSQELGLPVFPGAVTPTEIMSALRLGLETVKFFPADLNGGPAALKTLGAVFPSLRFIPTGGITAENMPSYLSLPQVQAVGGSWMVPPAAIESGDMDLIQRLCRQAKDTANSVRRQVS